MSESNVPASASALENYKQSFNHSLAFGKNPALLLIDFVEAYFDANSPLFADVKLALDSALRVRETASKAEIPIIMTRVVYHSSGIDGGRFFEKLPALEIFKADSPLGAFPSGLVPSDHELIIDKQYPSAFFGTSLASTLTALGVDTIILTGLTTSGCVRATCVDAVSHGFRPFIVSDACGDRHPDPHDANLFDMQAKYGQVVSEAEIIQTLVNTAPRSKR